LTGSGGRYEFVVSGSIGPVLRSLLADFDIEERPVLTRLHLRDANDAELLHVIAGLVHGDRQLELVRVVDGDPVRLTR
jgi:hypothetical protein